jgi:solute carrier family 25 oxoglutarate transporter 11
MYAGLSAGLLRQASYTTVRMGVYNTLLEHVTSSNGSANTTATAAPSFAVKAAVGMCAGAVGAFFGSPAEIALIRMTADGRLPAAERRNYRHVLDALMRISREEGVRTLWRGCAPTIGRAMVVNAAQLASYSQAKQWLISKCGFQDGIGLHFVASMISGLCTTIASMPLDIAKTRIQNMKVVQGRPEYSGSLDVIVKLVRAQGPFSLWKGFTPYYARLGPHTVLTFIVLEQLNATYIRMASS